MSELYNPVIIKIGKGVIFEFPNYFSGEKYVVISSKGFKSRGWDSYFPNAEYVIDFVSPNPTIDELSEYIKILSTIKFDSIVAIGGGSVIDSAKVLSVISDSSRTNILNYLEGKKACQSCFYDLYVFPTTAGTGSEVTPFATVWDDINKKKLSLTSDLIFPKYAFIDPELSLSLNVELTVISALDALSHNFESLWNKNANNLSKSIAFTAIDLIIDNLLPLINDLQNYQMRLKLGWASLIGGLSITQTKTAIAHSMSYPITSEIGIPHGLASGVFLPEILKYNKTHDKTGNVLEIYDKLSIESPLDNRLSSLYNSLKELNIFENIYKNKSKIMKLVPKMINPTRSVNNIVEVSYEGINLILEDFFNKKQL